MKLWFTIYNFILFLRQLQVAISVNNHNGFVRKVTIFSEMQLSHIAQYSYLHLICTKFTINGVKSNCKPKFHMCVQDTGSEGHCHSINFHILWEN